MKTYTLIALAMTFFLAACGSSGPVPKGVKVGKPYVIDGKTYYPSYDATYDKIGDASWYGPGFHGKYTANGEVFNQNDLTAAHPTLPMPSVVRVTNLENGKSAIIRINDRGPFKSNRIIDLSKASAQKLGVHSIHKVRVQFLPDETQQFIASAQTGEPISMASLNEKASDAKENSIIAATAPQIVESTVADTKPGQTVGSAAPVMSVSTNDTMPRQSPFIRSAMADDTITTSEVASAEPEVTELETSDYGTQGAIQSEPVDILKVTPPKQAAQQPVDQPSKEVVLHEPAPPSAPLAEKSKSYASAAPASGKNYMIQAGSFSMEGNAKKLSSSLKSVSSLSSKVIVDKVNMSGKEWWRVRAGPFGGKEQADAALDNVRSNGAPEARIVQQ